MTDNYEMFARPTWRDQVETLSPLEQCALEFLERIERSGSAYLFGGSAEHAEWCEALRESCPDHPLASAEGARNQGAGI